MGSIMPDGRRSLRYKPDGSNGSNRHSRARPSRAGRPSMRRSRAGRNDMPMHMQENLLEFMKNVELLMVVLYTLNIIMIICWLIFDNGWYGLLFRIHSSTEQLRHYTTRDLD